MGWIKGLVDVSKGLGTTVSQGATALSDGLSIMNEALDEVNNSLEQHNQRMKVIFRLKSLEKSIFNSVDVEQTGGAYELRDFRAINKALKEMQEKQNILRRIAPSDIPREVCSDGAKLKNVISKLEALRHEKKTRFHPNGALRVICEMTDGVANGTMELRYASGALKCRAKYKAGSLIESDAWYEAGRELHRLRPGIGMDIFDMVEGRLMHIGSHEFSIYFRGTRLFTLQFRDVDARRVITPFQKLSAFLQAILRPASLKEVLSNYRVIENAVVRSEEENSRLMYQLSADAKV